MKDVVVKDVCEVFILDEVNDKTYFFGVTATNSVTKSMTSTPIRGGIGGKKVATIFSDSDLSFAVTTALHNDDVYEMQNGKLFTTGEISVMKQETKKAIDNAGSVGFVIDGTPVDGEVTVLDKNGKEISATFATGTVTIATGVAGQYYTCIYKELQPSAQVLDLDNESFPGTYVVQLHTIAYQPNSNQVVADLYWLFDQCRPDGNFESANNVNENKQDSITMLCETPAGSNSYGKYAVVDRAAV